MTVSLTPTSLYSLPELRMASSAGSQTVQTMPPAVDFASVLNGYAAETVGIMRQGEAAAIAGIQGGLPLQTVVESMMAAERALQAGIAVRDKLVSSYLEISRMQI
jgi:flagellar hook-basal body complex protein FliE